MVLDALLPELNTKKVDKNFVYVKENDVNRQIK